MSDDQPTPTESEIIAFYAEDGATPPSHDEVKEVQAIAALYLLPAREAAILRQHSRDLSRFHSFHTRAVDMLADRVVNNHRDTIAARSVFDDLRRQQSARPGVDDPYVWNEKFASLWGRLSNRLLSAQYFESRASSQFSRLPPIALDHLVADYRSWLAERESQKAT